MRPTPTLPAGHDLISLLYNFLDACLYAFTSEDFIAKDFALLEMLAPGVSAEAAAAAVAANGPCSAAAAPAPAPSACPPFRISVLAYGEPFRYGEHAQGTEVKAITYSNMQIFTPWGRVFSAGGVGEAAGSAGGAEVRSEEEAGAVGEVEGAAAGGVARGGDVQEGGAGEGGAGEGAALDPHRPTGKRRGPFDVYVIVDI